MRFLGTGANNINNRPIPRHTLPEAFNIRADDYVINSGQFVNQRSQLQPQNKWTHPQSLKPPLKVYEPREDPRRFYQSEAYRREIVKKNVNNNEVTFAYPGNEVIRFGENKYSIRRPFNRRLRAQDQEVNIVMKGEEVSTDNGNYKSKYILNKY